MNRPLRLLAILAAASVSIASIHLMTPALAADTPTAGASDAALRESVETFWHYGKIARYDLAAAEAQKIIAKNADPVTALDTFEAVSSDRKDNLDQWLLRWQGVDAMKEPTTQILNVLTQAHRARRADPKYIEMNIQRLAINDRARVLATARLRESGELAVPALLNYLRDPGKKALQSNVRQVLRDLGRSALNPLVAATEAKDNDLLLQVITALGDIGYDVSVPYLARLANDPQQVSNVRAAAAAALQAIGAGNAASLNAADLFYDLAERFYYDRASIAADNRNPTANVWYWDESNGLVLKEVPPVIFNEIMAMRACEYALKLGNGSSDALSLWLASNYKRESQLPDGASDPTRGEAAPAAHFYGVSAGTRYLNAVLNRATHDYDAPVALRAVKSLEEIVGQSNLFSGEQSQSLIESLRFPDRTVRYESAFALANALPQQPFSGQEQVVPLLAEAISQTGSANALLLLATQDEVNAKTEMLKGIGYGAAGGTTAESAVAAAATKPAIDVVITTDDVDQAQIEKLMQLLGSTPRLERAAKVVITKNPASPWTVNAVKDPLLTVTQTKDAAGLKAVLEEARKKAGSLPLDEAVATKYALRAAELLSRLAISRGQVLDISVSEGSLLSALDDSRPDVVKAVGNTVALLKGKTAQNALITKALDEKTSDELKVSLFKSVAMSAKFNGNQVDQSLINALQKLVSDGKNPDVRSSAAEAIGALNLSTDQAKKLVIQQSKV